MKRSLINICKKKNIAVRKYQENPNKFKYECDKSGSCEDEWPSISQIKRC